jgi:cytochrome b involved in lipid metabolism
LGRALNEANNDLQNTREQLAISQRELLQKQQKTDGVMISINDNKYFNFLKNIKIFI